MRLLLLLQSVALFLGLRLIRYLSSDDERPFHLHHQPQPGSHTIDTIYWYIAHNLTKYALITIIAMLRSPHIPGANLASTKEPPISPRRYQASDINKQKLLL